MGPFRPLQLIATSTSRSDSRGDTVPRPTAAPHVWACCCSGAAPRGQPALRSVAEVGQRKHRGSFTPGQFVERCFVFPSEFGGGLSCQRSGMGWCRCPESWEDFRPSPGLLFLVVFVSYLAITSGVIYDVIIEPPSMGSEQDPVTGMKRELVAQRRCFAAPADARPCSGSFRQVAFLPYKVNGQYIIEGISGGFAYGLGALGFIALGSALDSNQSRTVSGQSCRTRCLLSRRQQ